MPLFLGGNGGGDVDGGADTGDDDVAARECAGPDEGAPGGGVEDAALNVGSGRDSDVDGGAGNNAGGSRCPCGGEPDIASSGCFAGAGCSCGGGVNTDVVAERGDCGGCGLVCRVGDSHY